MGWGGSQGGGGEGEGGGGEGEGVTLWLYPLSDGTRLICLSLSEAIGL